MMQEEISIEETNLLRVKAGLAPIPIDNPIKKPKTDLSIEETNKLRASLGLNPIEIKTTEPQNPVPSSSGNDKDELIKDRLQSIKHNNDRKRKLKFSKTLLDDYEQQTTEDWLSGLSKETRSKPIEKSIVKTTEEAPDIEFGHSIKELADIQDNDIFTLNDDDILAETDRLSNERLSKKAKVAKDLDQLSKIRDIRSGTGYQPLDNEEETEEYVRLDGSEIKLGVQTPKEVEPEGKKRVNMTLFDLEEDTKPKKPIKMKKLKKKSKGTERIKTNDEMISGDYNLKPIENDMEEDLEQLLNQQRKAKQKSRKLLKPEELAKEIRQYSRIQLEDNLEQSSIFNQTDEFLNSLVPRDDLGFTNENINPQEESIKKAINTQEEPTEDTPPESESNANVASVTPTSFTGMGSILKYLKTNTLLPETSNTNKPQRQTHELANKLKQQLIDQRKFVAESLKTDPVYQQLGEEEKQEYYDAILDEKLSKTKLLEQSQELISNYKPKVELTYKDNKGNVLDTKQAFKQLSSQYHGTKKAHPKGKDRKKMGKKK